MISQLTVYIENKPRRLEALCRALGDAKVSMQALMVADTAEFGIVRIVCDSPAKARIVLKESGFSSAVTDVIAVEVPDVPGGLASVLEVLGREDVSVEYAYCFMNPITKTPFDVLKVGDEQGEFAEKLFHDAGIRVLEEDDLHPADGE